MFYKKVGSYYVVESIYPKEFNPNIELVPWDLQSYSLGWKFIFNEFDISEQVTSTYQHTGKFATNFEFNAAWDWVVKLGFKVGASSETTNTQTHSITIGRDSDFLGEATLTFDQPVIVGGPSTDGGGTKFNTREITTGSYLSISVEPVKIF